MATHVWNRRPTREKYDRMEEAYNYARSRGASDSRAGLFAGYYLEAGSQTGFGRETHRHQTTLIETLYSGVVRNRWRLEKAKNAPHYRVVWASHARFALLSIAPMLWDLLYQGDLDQFRKILTGSGNLEAVPDLLRAETYAEFEHLITLLRELPQ